MRGLQWPGLAAFLVQFALGLCEPIPMCSHSEEKEPVSFLYNGIRLPALPEWDRGVYPKAIIYRWQTTTTSAVTTRLLCYSEEESPNGYRDSDGREYFTIDFPALASVYDESTDAWGALAHSDDAFSGNTGISMSLGDVIWSNHDINLQYKLLGTSYSDQFFATDPVPVYE